MAERRVLDSTELFASLPEEMVEQLRSQARIRELAKGDLLFGQGDESSDMYVVQEGRIAISTRSSDGRESMVAVMENGGLFGEMGLFDGGPRSAEARALTDTVLVEVAFDDVRAAVQQRPEVLWVDRPAPGAAHPRHRRSPRRRSLPRRPAAHRQAAARARR